MILLNKKEKEMIKKSQNGDMNARNILVEKNMRLVAHMIKKYMQYNDTSVYAIYYIAQNTVFYNTLFQSQHGIILLLRG